MSIIEFRQTSKHFGDLKVLDQVDLSIDAGQVVVLIGPSGSGKSTLLRCINGLEQITGGDLVVDGISVREPSNLFSHLDLITNFRISTSIT